MNSVNHLRVNGFFPKLSDLFGKVVTVLLRMNLTKFLRLRNGNIICHKSKFARITLLLSTKRIGGENSPRIVEQTGCINPKQCGLFGQLRRRGGVKVSLLQITFSGHSNFRTD